MGHLVNYRSTQQKDRHLSECMQTWGPPGVWGIWGEWLFIFRELGSTCNYFQGFGEQAHSFGDLGRHVSELRKVEE